jgi:hypothetical protein
MDRKTAAIDLLSSHDLQERIVCKKTLNKLTFTPEGNQELVKTIVAIMLHYVPEDRKSADLKLRPGVCFFGKTGTETAS